MFLINISRTLTQRPISHEHTQCCKLMLSSSPGNKNANKHYIYVTLVVGADFVNAWRSCVKLHPCVVYISVLSCHIFSERILTVPWSLVLISEELWSGGPGEGGGWREEGEGGGWRVEVSGLLLLHTTTYFKDSFDMLPRT